MVYLIQRKDHVKTVCKMGQGEKCCRYLGMGEHGFECLKKDELHKASIDLKWATESHVAQGDNCDGYEKEEDA